MILPNETNSESGRDPNYDPNYRVFLPTPLRHLQATSKSAKCFGLHALLQIYH